MMSRLYEYYVNCNKEEKIDFLNSMISDLEKNDSNDKQINYYKKELAAVKANDKEITVKGYTFAKLGPLSPEDGSLVDYVADGYLLRDGKRIPCELGYIDYGDSIELTHIFIQSGISASGDFYENETIEL